MMPQAFNSAMEAGIIAYLLFFPQKQPSKIVGGVFALLAALRFWDCLA